MKTISMLAATALALSALAAPAAADAAPMTQLTLKVPACDGCTVGVASYLQGSMDVWSAKPKKVEGGTVTFAVPTAATAGLSITVRAPWEGATGYVTNVALRYKGQQPGDKVGFTAARASTRASGCWAGTTEDTAAIKVEVEPQALPNACHAWPGQHVCTADVDHDGPA